MGLVTPSNFGISDLLSRRFSETEGLSGVQGFHPATDVCLIALATSVHNKFGTIVKTGDVNGDNVTSNRDCLDGEYKNRITYYSIRLLLSSLLP
jgi:hypothetical protein